MKNLFKLSLAVVGITMATLAGSSNVKAKSATGFEDVLAPEGAGCVGEKGTCGRTSSGTTLYGKWREW
ncbi:MAG TPA: hypothetical protein VF455_00860 [Chryseobacterium sp.]|uniref:Uncharacterized protein n=2 Tax=Chryseobacterium TaxID=59732 RepID=A0ABT3Y914_9FLAO|nr:MULTISPECIES: hypothetical protein [Chryseobacterium]MCX8526394.1 hypothetical protein [Chryseobacterium formosus]MCX8534642.1 hypothetical protein [Chryseobacterium luquanense]